MVVGSAALCGLVQYLIYSGRGMFPEVSEFKSLLKAMFFLYGILTMDDWYMYYLKFTKESHQVSDTRYVYCHETEMKDGRSVLALAFML